MQSPRHAHQHLACFGQSHGRLAGLGHGGLSFEMGGWPGVMCWARRLECVAHFQPQRGRQVQTLATGKVHGRLA